MSLPVLCPGSKKKKESSRRSKRRGKKKGAKGAARRPGGQGHFEFERVRKDQNQERRTLLTWYDMNWYDVIDVMWYQKNWESMNPLNPFAFTFANVICLDLESGVSGLESPDLGIMIYDFQWFCPRNRDITEFMIGLDSSSFLSHCEILSLALPSLPRQKRSPEESPPLRAVVAGLQGKAAEPGDRILQMMTLKSWKKVAICRRRIRERSRLILESSLTIALLENQESYVFEKAFAARWPLLHLVASQSARMWIASLRTWPKKLQLPNLLIWTWWRNWMSTREKTTCALDQLGPLLVSLALQFQFNTLDNLNILNFESISAALQQYKTLLCTQQQACRFDTRHIEIAMGHWHPLAIHHNHVWGCAWMKPRIRPCPVTWCSTGASRSSKAWLVACCHCHRW